MQIVIKMDEEDYKRIQDIPDVFNSLASRTYSAIRNGTPLPEHHGRLIDEKDLSLMTVHMIDGMLVCDAPTIIEGSESE
jgi:hypothetical protein